MAYRHFNLTLTGSYQNLYTLMLAVTGAVPTDGILPDRVRELSITAAVANSTTAVLVSDSNNANSGGSEILSSTGPFIRRSPAQTICLRDYNLKGNTLVVEVDIEA